jgi:hypothetical protein
MQEYGSHILQEAPKRVTHEEHIRETDTNSGTSIWLQGTTINCRQESDLPCGRIAIVIGELTNHAFSAQHENRDHEGLARH